MQTKIIGKIIDLFVSDKTLGRSTKDNITLNIGGVIDDKFYGKDIQRSVLITSLISYDLTKQNNIEISYGDLGENILIDYNPYNLQDGTKLQIGEVILEISQHCTLCKSLAKVDKNLPKLLKEHRGVFAKVIKNGQINKNDKLYLVA